MWVSVEVREIMGVVGGNGSFQFLLIFLLYCFFGFWRNLGIALFEVSVNFQILNSRRVYAFFPLNSHTIPISEVRGRCIDENNRL